MPAAHLAVITHSAQHVEVPGPRAAENSRIRHSVLLWWKFKDCAGSSSSFERLDVPYQAVGGLAANAYGAKRPPADLDFYVPTRRLEEVAESAAACVVRVPAHYQDESWDLTFMKLEYHGRQLNWVALTERATSIDRQVTGVRRGLISAFPSNKPSLVCAFPSCHLSSSSSTSDAWVVK